MHIYKELFGDEKSLKNRKKIIRKIKYRGGLANTYIISLADNADYFDIIPGYVLKQKKYPIKDLHIMGFADGYDSAVVIVTEMITVLSEKFGTVFFKEFLEKEKEMNFTGYNRK